MAIMPDAFFKPLPQSDIGDKQNFGIAIIFLSGFCFLAAVLDTHAKYLTQTLPVAQVTWARYFFHTVAIAPLVLYLHGTRAFLPPQMGFQMLRGSFLFISTFLYFLALAKIPIAETQALVFCSPLIVTMLGFLLLKEKVGAHRWAAVIAGFGGVMIVINPNPNSVSLVSLGAAAAVLAGVLYAFYIVATRQLRHSPPLVTLFFTGIIGSLVLTTAMPFVWQAPTALEFFLMVTLGLCGACSHMCIIQAFRRASASQLSPWMYVKMLFTVSAGYFLFMETPTFSTWIGGAIIICSGIYIWQREQMRAS